MLQYSQQDLLDILKKYIDVQCMEDAKNDWLKMEATHSDYVSVDYSYYNVIYQNCYFQAINDVFVDFSVVIYNGGVPVGIWPLSISRKGNEIQLGSWGADLLAPLLVDCKYNIEKQRKLIEKCILAIQDIADTYGVKHITCKQQLMQDGINIWTQKLFEHGWSCNRISNECYLNLAGTEEQILARIRRTNRYSIQKADGLWRHKLICKVNSTREEIEQTFEAFRDLHIEVAGRETRSIETWNLQRDAVTNNDDFVILLFDSMDKLIGASLYTTTGTEGSYAVAAYDRSLFDQPVGHISQWLAILHMKELGIKWYHVGTRFYEKDWNEPTEKEVAIGHFKEGWATNIFPRMFLENNNG